MAIGFLLAGTCWATTDDALLAFRSGFPQFEGDFVNTINSSSVAGSVITYSFRSYQISNNKAWTVTGSHTLASCDPEAMITAQLASMQIDSATVLEVFGWGFAVVFFGWSLGYLVQVGRDLVRKI